MLRAPVSPAVEIVADALLLRKAHPEWAALDVLDQVMQGRGWPIDFGELAVLPAPFALLVVEAFDTGMPYSDWEGLWRCNSHNEVRAFLLQLFADEIWPQFRVRYGMF